MLSMLIPSFRNLTVVKPSRFRSNLNEGRILNHGSRPKKGKGGLTSPRNKSQKKKNNFDNWAEMQRLHLDVGYLYLEVLKPRSSVDFTVKINTQKTQHMTFWGRVVCFGCVFSRMFICLRSHAERILVPSWQHGLMQSRSVKVPFTLQSRRINRSCQHFQMYMSPLIARDEWMMCWLQSARTTYES